MAKTDVFVGMSGSFQNVVTLLDTAVRTAGGENLTEAAILLGTPENSAAVEEIAGVLARVSKAHKAALEAAERVRVVNKTTLMVNLACAPALPFDGATIEHNTGGGWVKVEKKKDGLFVADKKVQLHLEGGQMSGTVRGHQLREALTGKPVLHPNIMDALFDNPHLIPEDFKQDKQEFMLRIFFWAVVYRVSDGRLYVRYLCWNVGAWGRGGRWLDHGFDVQNPAAVSAS